MSRRPGRFASAGAPFLAVLFVVLAFSPAIHAGFLNWDDDRNFLANPHYRGLGPGQLHWMWTSFHMGHYVPLTWMSHGLDYLLWGMNPLGYHLQNVLLHAANAVLLYFIARRILAAAAEPEGASRDDAPGIGGMPPARAHDANPGMESVAPAVFAALLFALHPLRVESVAWITERRDVLSGFFYFLAILCYLRSLDPARRRTAWYRAALAAFTAAVLSKASAVTLPAVLLVLDFYPLRRLGGQSGWWSGPARRVYAEKLPFLVIAAAGAAVAPLALGPVPQLDAAGKLAVSAYSLAFYVWKTLVPVGLSPLYPMPDHVRLAEPRFLASIAVVVLLTASAWTMRRRWPGLWAAWVAWCVLLLPISGLIQNGPQIAADRYTYLAGAVAALAFAGVVSRARVGRGLLPNAVLAAATVLAGILTFKQADTWHDSERLWTHALRTGSGGPIAQNNLGNALASNGKLEAAATQYREAIAGRTGYPEAHNNLGVVLSRQGRFDEAIAEFRQAILQRPEYADAQVNWGVALGQAGKQLEAIEHFREALRLDPGNAQAHAAWGNALVRAGRPADAVTHYRIASGLDPQDADAHFNWGVALAQEGKLPEAAQQFRRALVLEPGHAEAREALARLERLRAPPP
jgi:tetratricopeptide (TPR) repeat protein